MSSEITVYIKTLSGDIIPISFQPNGRNIHLLFKVQSLFPEYPVERIILYHNEFIDISNVTDGDILYLFITEPYNESWSSFSIINQEKKTYIINWYNTSKNDIYFYNKERKTSISLYINIDNNNFSVSVDNTTNFWFPDLHTALLNFQTNYNTLLKHAVFTDDKLIHSYHLWNLNTDEFYMEMIKSRYYDY